MMLMQNVMNLTKNKCRWKHNSKGRIVIAQKLIDYAQLKKECTIIGVGNRIEIWDTETYDKYLEENEDLIPAISEELDI